MLPCRKVQGFSHVYRRTLSLNLPYPLNITGPRVCRHYGTDLGPAPTGTLADELSGSLRGIVPRFSLAADRIQILHSPTEFYRTLLSNIEHAQRRIFLSTLYIGKTEHELVEQIRRSLERHPHLRVSILTDALRGTRERPQPSCASLLVPLVEQFGQDRVDIRMYHTPNLTGLRKAILPKRINEGWGLQHMKLYGTDDEIMLSGANLSSDYFSDRQDRYQSFQSTALADYYHRIHQAVGELSFRVLPDRVEGFKLDWPTSNKAPSPLEKPREFRVRGAATLGPLIQPSQSAAISNQQDAVTDTSVYPIAQFSQMFGADDKSTELPAVSRLLTTLIRPRQEQSSWTFTAGYFNIHPDLASLLLNAGSEHGTVITASPWANGFYGSKGISGLLPGAYTLLLRRFMRRVEARKKQARIRLLEWRRGTVGELGGWTYHAKGIWIGQGEENGPCATVIGSSNYTKRSYQLDLEVGAVIVTNNADLKQRLGAEVQNLQRHAKVTELAELEGGERRVGIRVRVAMWLVKILGGAL